MKNELYKNLMKRLVLSLMLLCFCFAADATNIQIDMSYFSQNPTTNRPITYQAMSPVQGNVFTAYSDSTGTAILSNCPNTLININILAPPAKTFIQVQLLPSDTGLIDATNRLASGSSSTYPSGQTAWAIATSDQRYQLSGSAQSNSFYPLFSNPSNYINSMLLDNATSSIYALLPQTNGFGNIVASNASSFVTPTSLIDATNKDYAAWLAAIQGTNNLIRGQLQYGSPILTNLSNTGAWTNSIVAGTNTTLSTNLGVVTINVPNQAFLTNALATTNYVNTATNGFVLSGITNGLATTNYANLTTNTIGIASGLMAFQQTNIWTTFNYTTNAIVTTSNALLSIGGTASNAIANLNGKGTNTFLLNPSFTNITVTIGATYFVTNFSVTDSNANYIGATNLEILANPAGKSGLIVFPHGDTIAEYDIGAGAAGDTGIAIGLGNNAPIYENYSFIAGASNDISANSGTHITGSTISGGFKNLIGSAGTAPNYSVISGGTGNKLLGPFGVISGGTSNSIIANGPFTTVLGGSNNVSSGAFSTISGGENNTSGGFSSWAGGDSAGANHNGTFVFNGHLNGSTDGLNTPAFNSTGTNQFLVNEIGGAAFNTNNPNGHTVFVNGDVWATNFSLGGVFISPLTNIVLNPFNTNSGSFVTGMVQNINSSYANTVGLNVTNLIYSVGAGVTNLGYLIGTGNTNLSYTIGLGDSNNVIAASNAITTAYRLTNSIAHTDMTNLFNQSGVNMTNISSAISNNLLNFVLITNGTAFYPTLKSNITLGVFPWLTTSTNVVGINSTGVIPANGTFIQIAVGTWTNILGNGSDIIFQNPTYFLRTNLVNLYSTSNLFFNSTWVNVIGSSAVPTNSGFGYIANHNGQWDTNIWASSLSGIVPMGNLDTVKIITNNQSANLVFNGGLTVGNNTTITATAGGYIGGVVLGTTTTNGDIGAASVHGGNFYGNGSGLTNVAVTSYVQGSLTNSQTFLLYTNNLAFVPGFGYTNWPSSTTAGIQEILNMFANKAIRNPAGGVAIQLASIGTSNKPAFYPITKCINATNYFTLQGNGMGATVIEYNGASIGTTNDAIPSALMFFTPALSSGDALNYFELHDLSLVSDIDCPAAMIATHANAFNISRCQFGSTNILYQTNFVSSPAYVGSQSLTPRGLIGVYANGQGNNQDAFYNCFFQDLADGIFADGVDWCIVQDCHFGSISMLNGTSFTNTWNTNVQYHVGAAIGASQSGLGWTIRNVHSLNCNTFFYGGTANPNVSVYDALVEACNWYSLGYMPNTYSKEIPSGSLGIWSTVNTFYQSASTTTSTTGAGFIVGQDGNDDFQYSIMDDTGRFLLKLPNANEETETGTGGILGNYMTWDNHGVFAFNGGGITNLNVNALAKSTAAIPTNTATILSTSTNNTNNFSTGTVYTAPNQRTMLVGSVMLSSAVGGSANITLAYTNNSLPYFVPMQSGSGIAIANYIPFSVPLAPNATFSFIATMGSGASGYVTNAVIWKQ